MTKKDPKAFVTNETLDQTVGEAVDTILTGMDNIVAGLKDEMKTGFKQVNTRLDKVEADVLYMKDDIKGLTADLSDVPTRKEFNEVMAKAVA
jgi:hypothetical protein